MLLMKRLYTDFGNIEKICKKQDYLHFEDWYRGKLYMPDKQDHVSMNGRTEWIFEH